MYVYVYIYIYTCREREREMYIYIYIERERHVYISAVTCITVLVFPALARTRLAKLKKQCPDRPSETGEQVVRIIYNNKLPYGLKVWPDEEGAQCPS